LIDIVLGLVMMLRVSTTTTNVQF